MIGKEREIGGRKDVQNIRNGHQERRNEINQPERHLYLEP